MVNKADIVVYLDDKCKVRPKVCIEGNDRESLLRTYMHATH